MWWNDYESITYMINQDLGQVEISTSEDQWFIEKSNHGVFYITDPRYLACKKREKKASGFVTELLFVPGPESEWPTEVEPLIPKLANAPNLTKYEKANK